ncbi:MAG: hypothetical protein WDN66_00080 [Candidatus Saccharibacteria bacterium]
MKSVADRYAAEGYIALAPNLLFEIDFSNIDLPEMQKQLLILRLDRKFNQSFVSL